VLRLAEQLKYVYLYYLSNVICKTISPKTIIIQL